MLTFSAWAALGQVREFSLPDLSGQPQSLRFYPGNIVILNFWATWCVPCREEMPLLRDLQKRYGAQGVVVIGASADDEGTRGNIRPFIAKHRITFPIWTGATTEHMQELGLGATLPATAVIDREGHIVARIFGKVERRNLEPWLEYLLGRKADPAPPAIVDKTHDSHGHKQGEQHEEKHTHGAVGLEGASTVPS